MFKKTQLALVAGLLVAAGSAQAEAPEPSAEYAGLESITVTSQKREQDLQEVPIAVSAFDSSDIEDQKIYDVGDVSVTVPNVQIAPSPGGATGATIAIRGASMINPAVTWEPAVGMYFDGIFVSKNTGGLFDVAEIERIEVLRGPQGTLYGKNTTGGAINIITRDPSEDFQATVKAGNGKYGYKEGGLSVDTGYLGTARFNFAYTSRERDGFYDNLSAISKIDEFKQLDSEAGRLSSLIDVSETTSVKYDYDWSRRDNTVAMGQLEVPDWSQGFPPPAPEMKRAEWANLDGAGFEESDNQGHALTLTMELSDTLTFKSLTSLREMNFDDENDYDGFPTFVQPVNPTDPGTFHTERHIEQEQKSQEFQFLGNADSFDYVAGVYLLEDENDVENPFIVGLPSSIVGPMTFPVPLQNFYGVETDSAGVFGQVDYYATDSITLTLGGRYTKEEKEAYVNKPGPFGYNARGTEEWTNFSPTFVVSYAVNEDMTTYAKVSKGWKAGGFNAEAATQLEASTPYDEEVLTAYELGLKSDWSESFQSNLAVFQNEVDDLQVSAWNATTNASEVSNAGEATIKGAELENKIVVTQNLVSSINFGYLDPEYNDFVDPVTGMQIKDTSEFAYSPRHTRSIELDYSRYIGGVEWRAHLDYSYVDEQYFYYDAFSAAVTKADAYLILNGRVAVADIALGSGGKTVAEIGFWGKNMGDTEYRLNGIPTATGAALNYYGDPRTYGADLIVRF